VAAWRAARDPLAVAAALDRLRAEAGTTANLMDATLACVRAGVTTGEWAGTLRSVFGEYRAPTGLSAASSSSSASDLSLADVRARLVATAAELGVDRLRLLVGKPGLDGHSNGAEQIAVRARDAGFEVVYQGIRLTPAQIVSAAVEEDVDLVGLSVLSGSHLAAVPAVLDGLRAAGRADLPLVVGGIIPAADAEKLLSAGVARVFTPKDFALTGIVDELVTVVRAANGLT
jgi:(2R)-ethylmalonyl-CoA mutase